MSKDPLGRKFFHCKCGDPDHYVAVWFDHEVKYRALADNPPEIELVFGTPEQSRLSDRIRAAWDVLRGRHVNHGIVILDRRQARDMQQILVNFIGGWWT